MAVTTEPASPCVPPIARARPRRARNVHYGTLIQDAFFVAQDVNVLRCWTRGLKKKSCPSSSSLNHARMRCLPGSSVERSKPAHQA